MKKESRAAVVHGEELGLLPTQPGPPSQRSQDPRLHRPSPVQSKEGLEHLSTLHPCMSLKSFFTDVLDMTAHGGCPESLSRLRRRQAALQARAGMLRWAWVGRLASTSKVCNTHPTAQKQTEINKWIIKWIFAVVWE